MKRRAHGITKGLKSSCPHIILTNAWITKSINASHTVMIRFSGLSVNEPHPKTQNSGPARDIHWARSIIFSNMNAFHIFKKFNFPPYNSFFQSPCRLQYSYAATALSLSVSANTASGFVSGFKYLI